MIQLPPPSTTESAGHPRPHIQLAIGITAARPVRSLSTSPKKNPRRMLLLAVGSTQLYCACLHISSASLLVPQSVAPRVNRGRQAQVNPPPSARSPPPPTCNSPIHPELVTGTRQYSPHSPACSPTRTRLLQSRQNIDESCSGVRENAPFLALLLSNTPPPSPLTAYLQLAKAA